MNTSKNFRASRIIGRFTRIWSELDYAQRRMFEIRTGISGSTRSERPRR